MHGLGDHSASASRRKGEKMKIIVPSTIRIGGLDFKIGLQEDLSDDGTFGDANFRRLRMRIGSNLLLPLKSVAYLHEILHSINSVYLPREALDEGTIITLSQGLWQVLEQLGIEFDFSGLPTYELTQQTEKKGETK
jgi:hypothetical protein